MKLQSCKNLYLIVKRAQDEPEPPGLDTLPIILGSGIGGLGMGLYTSMKDKSENKKERTKNIVTNILYGMAGGAATGAGVSGVKHIYDVNRHLDDVGEGGGWIDKILHHNPIASLAATYGGYKSLAKNKDLLKSFKNFGRGSARAVGKGGLYYGLTALAQWLLSKDKDKYGNLYR